ncbi:MAG: hypothetical protein HY928_05735 [Elusimicrobia bacterium]|nr:hypothetical protein [Elusimicrobiota bacterium]
MRSTLVKRREESMTRKAALSLFIACCQVLSGTAPALAQFRAGHAPAGAAPVRAVAPLAAPAPAPVLNPALPGGIRALGGLAAPTLSNPSVAAAAAPAAVAAPAAAAARAAAIPSVLPAAAPAQTGAAAPRASDAALPRDSARSPVSVLQAAGEFANAVSKPAKGSEVAGRSRKVFDGGAKAEGSGAPAVSGLGGVRASGGGPGGLLPSGGGSDDGSPSEGPRSELSFRALKDGSDVLAHLPRTLVVNDAFGGPASDADVRRLQALIDRGVHVVFLTDRPERGAGSADEVLLSRLRPGKDNPVAVASYSGARISFVEAAQGGARWTVASEAGAFEARELERFGAAAAKALSSLRVAGAVEADGSAPFAHTMRLPAGVPAAELEGVRKAFLAKFNASMRASGLPYRAAPDPADPRAAVVRSMSQPLALGRLAKALETRFAAEDLGARGREAQLLAGADLRELVASAPGAVPDAFLKASLAAPEGAAALSDALAAVSGEKALPAAEVSMTDLRSHIDFWKPQFKDAGGKGKSGGLGQFGLYTWKVLHGLLTDFYVDTAQAGKRYPSLKLLLEELDRRWAGATGDKAFDSFRRRKGRDASGEYLRHARTFVTNFWNREVGDFALAKDEIRANLMTEGSVFTSVPLRSPFTGRRYDLGVSVDRVMKLDTARGRELSATVYRFGREEGTEGDTANARAVALAVLRAYGRKGTDLRWHQQSVTGPAISRIVVQVEYLKRSRTYDFSPEELLAIEADGTLTQGPEVLALIAAVEREQGDAAYLKSLKKAGKRAASPSWGGDEWAQKGGALRALFAQYHPAVDRSATGFRGAAGRTAPAEPARPAVLDEPIRFPAEPLPQAVLEDGSNIEGVTAAPRVVFIEDVFEGPASETTVAYVQKLIDRGAHVVFMTARPHMGAGSADEVLLSRLKVSQKNPPIVVSYNGARIALHSHAKDPKPYIADSDAFAPEALAAFKEAAAAVSKELKLVGLAEAAAPSEAAAFQYTLRLPDSLPASELDTARKAVVRRFIGALARAGLSYTLQAHPDDARLLWVRSQPLRLSLERVFEALDTRFKGEDLLANPMTFLVLGDSKRSLKLSTAWPKGVTFRPASGDADVSMQIGVVLGDLTRKPVGVKLGEIRQWDEYWAPMLLRRGGGRPAPGSDAKAGGGTWAADRGYNGPMGMFTGSLFYRLMPALIENIWRGQDRLTTLTQGEKLLRQMWNKPVQHGVFVSRKQAALMQEAGWKERSSGYLERALAIFRETYNRMFEHYSEAAADIMHNLAGLTSDGHSLITVPFVAGNTLYRVLTRLPRLMKHDTPEGRVLTVHAHRTGKQPFEGDGDSVYARTLAMAMLVGFSQPGPDGAWHDGWAEGPRIAKLHVRFEYKDGGLDLYFNPNDFFSVLPNGKLRQGPIVREIANTIERMRADKEFQEHYQAEVEEAKPEDLKKARTAKAKTEGKTKTGGKP